MGLNHLPRLPDAMRLRSMHRARVTPVLGDHQARMLLAAPPDDALQCRRDRATLATLL